MQFTPKYMLSLGTLAAALVLTGSFASAQRATFTLPFEAHVGKATLPAGEYRLHLPTAENSIRTVQFERDGKVQIVLPATTGNVPETEQAHFEFVNIDGAYFAKKFVSGTGTVYEFQIPKFAHHSVVASSGTTTVSVSGGAMN